ncbi:MAG TPA: class I SAM-dependent methyltransferase [Anaerolineales bacterium]|nr:class I SAM-dependent methyltransferase [Anaerolineales bacterium]
MDHSDHVNLLRPANLPQGGTWADLGAGSGAFTLALRELIGPDATIYAVDKDRRALAQLDSAHRARFGPSRTLIPLNQDFSRLSDIPALDGVVMANSLHFFKDKERVLQHVHGLLKPNGALLLIEYNVDSGNMWVPHPLTFEMFSSLATHAGYTAPRLLAKVPSRFLKEFYSAVAYKTIMSL